MKTSFILGAVTVAGLTAGAAFAGTLDDVKARGKLNCGVSTGVPGFAEPDANGVWQALTYLYVEQLRQQFLTILTLSNLFQPQVKLVLQRWLQVRLTCWLEIQLGLLAVMLILSSNSSV
mgnify:CR=1 FL=1